MVALGWIVFGNDFYSAEKTKLMENKKEGLCFYCKQPTAEIMKFCDDVEKEENGNYTCSSYYEDFCHEQCFNENLDAER